MSLNVTQAQNYTNLTSTTTVASGPGGMFGIFVASASSTPTLKVTDGAATVVNTFTPVGATFYTIPARFGTDLKVTVGGTVDCTVFWSP
ncbi:MAG: hypothetical protein EBS78_11080 [Altererythrobacter sp.]|jgi:hypothetical protein|nr:hypothetical protein [Altererythrobacter sp.]